MTVGVGFERAAIRPSNHHTLLSYRGSGLSDYPNGKSKLWIGEEYLEYDHNGTKTTEEVLDHFWNNEFDKIAFLIKKLYLEVRSDLEKAQYAIDQLINENFMHKNVWLDRWLEDPLRKWTIDSDSDSETENRDEDS